MFLEKIADDREAHALSGLYLPERYLMMLLEIGIDNLNKFSEFTQESFMKLCIDRFPDNDQGALLANNVIDALHQGRGPSLWKQEAV